MKRFEQDLEAFKKCLCERASLIMKQWEEAQVSNRRRRAGCIGQPGKGGATRSALRAQAINASGPPMLVGWKEIAQALGSISTRTAQRWEKCLGLPIGRVGGTPVAEPDAIRQWKERHFNTTLK